MQNTFYGDIKTSTSALTGELNLIYKLNQKIEKHRKQIKLLKILFVILLVWNLILSYNIFAGEVLVPIEPDESEAIELIELPGALQ